MISSIHTQIEASARRGRQGRRFALVGPLAVGIILATGLAAVPQSATMDTNGSEVADVGDADALSYEPPQWPEAPDTRAMLLRLGLGSAVVLGLCAATLWAGRRWIGGPVVRGTGGGQLRVLEVVPLGNRCSVYLLEAGRRQVLAALDGSGFKALVPLPELFEQALGDVQSAREPEPLTVGAAD